MGKNRAVSRWVGQSIPRREDLPLLTGRGQFVDDVQVANPLHVAFARSPWAHAEIRSVDLGRGARRARRRSRVSPAPSSRT